MRPDCPQPGTDGTPGTRWDASTPNVRRLGAERSQVQILSPRSSVMPLRKRVSTLRGAGAELTEWDELPFGGSRKQPVDLTRSPGILAAGAGVTALALGGVSSTRRSLCSQQSAGGRCVRHSYLRPATTTDVKGGRVMGRRTSTLALTAMLALGLGLPPPAHALAPVGPGVVGLWQGEGDATDPFNGHNGTLLGEMGFAPASPGRRSRSRKRSRRSTSPTAPPSIPADRSRSPVGCARPTRSIPRP